MSYTALYRVWRPRSFQEVVGQDHISHTLRNAILKNRVSHAYLFTGPRGTGKTSLAKIMGKALNCLNLQEGEPCNQCPNCVGINEGSFLDYFEIDAASNRGIDEIRDMREKVKFAPSQGRTKVYVIDEVHMLTNEAFNALLKTLEEPPAHVVFILATTEPQKIPATILSRCQRYDFKRISEEGIRQRLEEIIRERGFQVDPEVIPLIIKKAEGGMRDAISILDQGIASSPDQCLRLSEVEEVLGTLNEEQLQRLMEGVLGGNPGSILSDLDNWLSGGKEVKQIIKDLIDFVREIILAKVTGKPEHLKILAGQRSLTFFQGMLRELIEGEQRMYFFSRPRIVLESLLLDMAEPETSGNLRKEAPPENQNRAKAPPVPSPEKQIQALESLPKTSPPPVSKGENAEALWKAVLEELRSEKITLHACAIAGRLDMDQDGFRIVFDQGRKFHQEKTAESENIRLIATLLERHVKREVSLQAVLEGESPPPKSGERQPKKTVEKGSSPEPDLTPEERFAEAARLFGAGIVEMKK